MRGTTNVLRSFKPVLILIVMEERIGLYGIKKEKPLKCYVLILIVMEERIG